MIQKDLTNSQIDRSNILNNEIALAEIEKAVQPESILLNDTFLITKEMAAAFFAVEIRTIERMISEHSEELFANGYEVLRGEKLKLFIDAYNQHFATDMNVGHKIRALGVFSLRAFLNLGMLLTESENARLLRKTILDIVIDVVNKKTGGATTYINQRDRNFISAYFREGNYRKEFTDALHDCVDMGKFKYSYYTDMIYQSIFREKAKEYREILNLKAKDRTRDTFYSEILDIIASYENGLAADIRSKASQNGRMLHQLEVNELFQTFSTHPLWAPLLASARSKMASRDLALRDAFHQHLSEYITPLSREEYLRFLGNEGGQVEHLMHENNHELYHRMNDQDDMLELLMQENEDVLRRLKERG